jgi:guanylate kinase
MNAPAHQPLVYIISAPSGSGKSTLVNELLKSVPKLDFSISYTTRAPRGSEQNGKQYYFVARDQFEQMIQDGEFLEYAQVFGKHYYGTARRFLREAEQKAHDLLLDIDVQGAAQLQQKLPAATSIFILPPDRKTLEERLRKRSEDDEEVIQGRLLTASREIQNYTRYNYILINDRLPESIEMAQAIVLSERFLRSGDTLSDSEARIVKRAESCRLANMRDRLKRVLESFEPGDDAGAGNRR